MLVGGFIQLGHLGNKVLDFNAFLNFFSSNNYQEYEKCSKNLKLETWIKICGCHNNACHVSISNVVLLFSSNHKQGSEEKKFVNYKYLNQTTTLEFFLLKSTCGNFIF